MKETIIMAIGQRIKFFRNRKGMTQKQFGEILGFLGKTSDVRMAQYESEARVPKIDLVKEMAQLFDISPHALTVPNIDSYIGLMHTLFALEDIYGLKIGEIDGVWVNPQKAPTLLYLICSIHGNKKLPNWKMAKSQKKHMINGVINIQN